MDKEESADARLDGQLGPESRKKAVASRPLTQRKQLNNDFLQSKADLDEELLVPSPGRTPSPSERGEEAATSLDAPADWQDEAKGAADGPPGKQGKDEAVGRSEFVEIVPGVLKR